ncbi:MAG: thioredoxin domain-containing protein [Myxococcales bacterium]|nr:thioredoxin domain-containing protein [Myxococcales bacterium]MCB9645607.1 thioredoxin domain-containing protein [Deltaproteobacteria bacterium]
MKTGAAFVGFLFSAVVGFAVGYSVNQAKQGASPSADSGSKKIAQGKEGAAKPAAEPESDIYQVPVGTSYANGPSDALVTIVEFSDFQCPFCGRVVPTLHQIEKNYEGDVRVVFKHQPLPFHRDAPLASEYALAAGEQGKFWEMHDKLFENQKALSQDDLDRYVKELGLDLDKVKAFVESGRGKKTIQEDQDLARKVGANGTPAFFINGENLVGAQPYEKFKEVVDAQLAKAKALVAKGVSKKDVYAELTKNGRTSAPPPKPREAPQAPPQTRQKVDLVAGTPAKGNTKDALVTIVEWSDFECPFCGRVNPTIKEVMDTYKDKVQVQFRNQPLSFHKSAMPAAKAAQAAHKQGKFWQMHDKLFENQRALQPADLEKYAAEIGLNVAQFKKDMESPEVDAIIKKDMEDGAKYGARGTPTLFVNGIPVRGAQPFPAFKTVIDKELELAEKVMKDGVAKKDVYAEILKREAGKTVAGAAPTPSAPPAPTGPVKIDIGRAPTMGPKNAPIKVVMWSDFQCPFCGRVNPSIDQLKKEYGTKIQFAFKQYPLPFHQQAKPAAIASLAAHRQGKFWEMHAKLFENQKALGEEDLVKYAGELGLDVGKFQKDLKDPELAAWVDQDMAEGSKVGVRGTPATFINGRLVSGAQPYPAFKAVVDEELKK